MKEEQVKINIQFHCPQCGYETEELFEGYCEDCCNENQLRLDEHNAQYDYWQSINDNKRNDIIKINY